MGLLKGKVAVISGATSGIGAASAKLLSAEGATVVCVGRNVSRGNVLVREIAADGGMAEFFACDVSNEAQIRELAAYIGEKYQKVDILFNNAGVMPPSAEIENMPVENWHVAFEVNIDGLFYVTRNLKKYLVSTKGCIINNASIAGMHSYVVGRSYAYSAAKAAVIQFSRQMAKNYAEVGVRVNCICPGIIDTPMLEDRDRTIYAERVPLGHIGAPMDVASVVLFLASDYSAYVTGAVIPIDGGVSLGGVNRERICHTRIKVKEMVCQELYDDLSAISRGESFRSVRNSVILVTGGTGFITYYLALAILSNNDISHAGNTVVLTVRDIGKALEMYRGLVGRSDLRFHIQDVREEVLCGYMPVDYIIHAAMAAEPSCFDNDPIGVFETAVNGTRRILDFAISKKVKSVVYLSSVTIYGDAGATDMIAENYVGNEDWKDNRACYMYGKRCAEFLCLASYRKRGLSIKIVRPGYVYGVGKLNDMRVYSEIIRNAASGLPIILKSSGLLKRPLVYVTNLVRAILCVMVNGVDGAAYNVADGEYSVRQFAEIAVRVSGSVDVCLKYTNGSDMFKVIKDERNLRIDCRKIKDECGYLPVIGVEKGIKDALKIYAFCKEVESNTEQHGISEY